jgi:general stress protein YciG
MAGTKEGGVKASITNKAKYGSEFYKTIGRRGGKATGIKGFASGVVGKDGLTGRQRAKLAGQKGGAISKRGPKNV